MPKVPQYNHKPIKSLYIPRNLNESASMKQKNLIITLCERRKLTVPDLKNLTSGKASEMISAMLDGSSSDN